MGAGNHQLNAIIGKKAHVSAVAFYNFQLCKTTIGMAIVDSGAVLADYLHVIRVLLNAYRAST